MKTDFYYLVIYVAILSTLIPLICLFIYRKSQPRQNMILGVCLLISFGFDILGFILAKVYHNNVLSNNLYFIVSFPAIMWFYHETLIRKSLKVLVRVFSILFLIFTGIFTIDQGLYVVNQNIMTTSSILISITSFFFVVDLNLMSQSEFVKNPFHQSNIILNTSLALYYFFTIALFPIWDFVHTNLTTRDVDILYLSHNLLHIFKNLGIALAFYLAYKHFHNNSKVKTLRA